MLVVTVYLKYANKEYRQVCNWLQMMQEEIPHKIVEINITNDSKLEERLGGNEPVVQVGPYILRWPFTEIELCVSLRAAADRKKHFEETGDKGYQNRIRRGHVLSGADRFALWFSKYYMGIISVILALYVGLPFLAPALMHLGYTSAAKVIYSVYRPLCHQLGFRSIFLYGEQIFYPRELAHLSGYHTWEEITNTDEINLSEAGKFLGNPQIGYKTALCQRDLAMYGSLLFFAFIFVVSKRKIKSIPWYIWIFVGLVPIAVDGFSQLPGVLGSIMPVWLPVRESVPMLRFITGFFFGFTTGWYLFPMFEEGMSDTHEMLERKKSIIYQLKESELKTHASSK